MGRGSPALQARYGEFQRMGLPKEKERPPLTLAESELISFSFFFLDLCLRHAQDALRIVFLDVDQGQTSTINWR